LTCRGFVEQNPSRAPGGPPARVEGSRPGSLCDTARAGGTVEDRDEQRTDLLFLQMVLSLQASAMQHLGKIADPVTGEARRDLPSARAAVDMLLMLKEKTRGNCSGSETRLLERVICDLQLNYVDETGPGGAPPPEGSAPEAPADSPSDPNLHPGEDSRPS
jgi:hypothetical protein